MDVALTWHHGLVADWWAEFNTDGPEIEYFGRFVERGQPALDAGCGAGRLLVPWLQAGYDVDGCDASADMIARCRARAAREGLDPRLLVQPLHELDPPRRYATIVACGVFGLGSTRAQDQEALHRFRRCLEPGGLLLLDTEAPYSRSPLWARWTKDGRRGLPASWPAEAAERMASDGSVLALRSRTLAVDPLDQCVVRAIRAEKRVDGRVVSSEEHVLSERMYFRNELLLMLEAAGFSQVDVRGGYTDEPATADHDCLVFLARA